MSTVPFIVKIGVEAGAKARSTHRVANVDRNLIFASQKESTANVFSRASKKKEEKNVVGPKLLLSSLGTTVKVTKVY